MGQFGIGQPVRRFEDRRFLRGEGRFQHDVNLPHQAHAVVLRSPHAHARIRALDTGPALALPGVLAVYTGAAEGAEAKNAVWDECPDNSSNLFEAGNKAATDAAFAQAAQIVRRRYVISRVYAHFMEPRGAIGVWDPGEERFTLYADVQYPHRERQALATRIFKISESRIRVITGDVGGC